MKKISPDLTVEILFHLIVIISQLFSLEPSSSGHGQLLKSSLLTEFRIA